MKKETLKEFNVSIRITLSSIEHSLTQIYIQFRGSGNWSAIDLVYEMSRQIHTKRSWRIYGNLRRCFIQILLRKNDKGDWNTSPLLFSLSPTPKIYRTKRLRWYLQHLIKLYNYAIAFSYVCVVSKRYLMFKIVKYWVNCLNGLNNNILLKTLMAVTWRQIWSEKETILRHF